MKTNKWHPNPKVRKLLAAGYPIALAEHRVWQNDKREKFDKEQRKRLGSTATGPRKV